MDKIKGIDFIRLEFPEGCAALFRHITRIRQSGENGHEISDLFTKVLSEKVFPASGAFPYPDKCYGHAVNRLHIPGE